MTRSQDDNGATLPEQSDAQPGSDSSTQKVEVVVIGDVYWDTVIVPWPSEKTDPKCPGNDNTYVRVDGRAGAWLLERLIERASKTIPGKLITVKGYSSTSVNEDNLKADKWGRALTVVKRFPKGIGGDMKTPVYRIKECYGWVAPSCRQEHRYPPPPDLPIAEPYLKAFEKLNKAITTEAALAANNGLRIVVINDDNHIFRHLEAIDKVVKQFTQSASDFLVLAMASPLAKCRIWDLIEDEIKRDATLAERIAVVVPAAALRSECLNIPESRAIETAAYDLARHVHSEPVLQKLMKCQHVIVRDPTGIFHFDKKVTKRFDYYFRPFEGGPESNPGVYGSISGYEKILIASIVKQMMLRSASTDSIKSDPFSGVPEGICSALRLWAKHFEIGFSSPRFLEYIGFSSGDGAPVAQSQPLPINTEAHPFDHLFEEPEDEKPLVAWVQFPFPLDALGTWSRVSWFRENMKTEQDFVKCLAEVVKRGPEKAIKIHNNNNRILCPLVRIGELKAVDREEIDGFNDIYKIIEKYLEDDTWKTPLSLAVFGTPGTGKSFTVREILKAVRSSTGRAGNGDALVYNLAQFTSPANLTIAFHQVQDAALSETAVPLIFFDEFDASLGGQPYGWLKYFLAPMQDGKFKGAETEGIYTVGRAIFVFAGGTTETFDKFKAKVAEEKNVKGPDFISRLRGYLNIKGINKNAGEHSVSDLLALRRAIILRSILDRKAERIFDELKIARIDDSLINAFLRVDGYEHGVRSMEAIVEMSSRPENGHLRVASLPSPDQLRMHVNVEQFLSLARQEPTTQ